MPTAVLTSKGQITIPKEVRQALGVETGDRLEFVETGKGVFEVVAASRDVRELKGVIDVADWNDADKLGKGKDMRKAVARRAGR